MSRWAGRKKRIEVDSDYDPLTSIPMLEPDNFNLSQLEPGNFNPSQAKSRLTTAFDLSDSKNITIIDPYLLERDIQTILELFATQADRNITIITCLERVKSNEEKSPEKVETAKTLKRIADDLGQKGVFNSFEIIKAKFIFHDRFFICTDEDKDGLFISSGGSLNMLLKNYSGLIRITNKTFKRSLLQFIAYSKKNGYTLSEFIEKHS